MLKGTGSGAARRDLSGDRPTQRSRARRTDLTTWRGAVTTLALASSSAIGVHAADDPDSSALQTVTVTARKRAEDAQAVPISITAYNQEELEARSVQRLSDLGQLTPNLLYGQKIQSGSSAGQVYIRGIGQQDTNVAFSPGVGIYVDGVYLGRAQANDVDMPDIADGPASRRPDPLPELWVGPECTINRIDERWRDQAELTGFARREIGARQGWRFSGSQILPFIVGDNARAMTLAAAMQARGFDIRGIRPPTVPAGTARLRISLTNNVDENDVRAMLEALAEVTEERR